MDWWVCYGSTFEVNLCAHCLAALYDGSVGCESCAGWPILHHVRLMTDTDYDASEPDPAPARRLPEQPAPPSDGQEFTSPPASAQGRPTSNPDFVAIPRPPPAKPPETSTTHADPADVRVEK